MECHDNSSEKETDTMFKLQAVNEHLQKENKTLMRDIVALEEKVKELTIKCEQKESSYMALNQELNKTKKEASGYVEAMELVEERNKEIAGLQKTVNDFERRSDHHRKDCSNQDDNSCMSFANYDGAYFSEGTQSNHSYDESKASVSKENNTGNAEARQSKQIEHQLKLTKELLPIQVMKVLLSRTDELYADDPSTSITPKKARSAFNSMVLNLTSLRKSSLEKDKIIEEQKVHCMDMETKFAERKRVIEEKLLEHNRLEEELNNKDTSLERLQMLLKGTKNTGSFIVQDKKPNEKEPDRKMSLVQKAKAIKRIIRNKEEKSNFGSKETRRTIRTNGLDLSALEESN